MIAQSAHANSNFSAHVVKGYQDYAPEIMLTADIPWQSTNSFIKPPLFESSFWIKIRPDIDHATSKAEPWVFSAGVPGTDWMSFTIFKDGKKQVTYLWGDKLDIKERSIPFPLPTFGLNLQKGDNTDILIQVKSPFLSAFHISLNPLSIHIRKTDAQHFLHIAYIAITLLMVAYHLFIFYLTKERAYLFYSAACFGFFLVTTGLNGYGFHYFWRNLFWVQDRSLAFGIALSIWGYTTFILSFFKSNNPEVAFWKPYLNCVKRVAISSMVMCFIIPPLYTNIFSAAIILPAMLIFSAATYANIKHSKSLMLINIGIAINVLGGLVSGAVIMNTTEPNFFTLNAFLLANIIDLFLFSSALARHINKMKAEKESIIRSLSGIVSDNLLSDITNNFERLPRSTVCAEVTVMFVDIEGFSKLFEVMQPTDILESLKDTFGLIAELVHAKGGTIDRSLGDGILVFFGYDLVGNTTENHRSIALQTAIAIQKRNFEKISKKNTFAVLPLRIGIHSAECFLGNIGKEGRIDYTIIGNGVNLANRYETSCSPHRIVISEQTWQGLDPHERASPQFNPLKVKIKHMSQLTRAYEYNPFITQFQQLLSADYRYWHSREIKQATPRFRVESYSLRLESLEGDTFEVRNFSKGGFLTISDYYYSRGVEAMITIKTPSKELRTILQEGKLDKITVQTRWSREKEGRFLHGFKIIGLHTAVQDDILEALQNSLPNKVIIETA